METVLIIILVVMCGTGLLAVGLASFVLSSQLSREEERAREEWE